MTRFLRMILVVSSFTEELLSYRIPAQKDAFDSWCYGAGCKNASMHSGDIELSGSQRNFDLSLFYIQRVTFDLQNVIVSSLSQ